MAEAKLNRSEVEDNICLVLNGQHELCGLPPFKFGKYHAVEPSPGVWDVLLEGPNQVVQQTTVEGLAAAISKYCRFSINDPAYRMRTGGYLDLAKCWLYAVDKIEHPPPMRELSEDGLCFHRLPFDIATDWPDDGCPLFEEMLSRTSNSDALCAFIGSLFFDEADREQYLYFYGDANSGKSKLTELLFEVLGQSAGVKSVPDTRDRFWSADLVGKRLVAFHETARVTFPQSGYFKQLCGGDRIPMEIKGGRSFTAKINTKFMFVSNEEVILSGHAADLRRCIPCHVTSYEGEPLPGKEYMRRLREEAPNILGWCKWIYQKDCGEHGRIPVKRELIEHLADLANEEFERLIQNYFEFDPLVATNAATIMNVLIKHEKEYRNSRKLNKFYEYLTGNHPVEKKKEKGGPRMFHGLKVKGTIWH